ncbi:hypothetical protein OC835_007225, partial [Tilletia horrida]
SKPRTELEAPDLSNELTLPQVQRILTFGRTQGWPVEPEDVVDRLFRQLKAYTDVIIKDLVKELADVDQHALTDLRGAGYYGPYHAALVVKEIKSRLRKEAPSATDTAIATIATNALPLLFERLIAEDTSGTISQAAELLSASRVYGLIVFPVALLGEQIRAGGPYTP